MKYETEQAEAMERAREAEQLQRMEQPPKMERSEIEATKLTDGTLPPKLARGGTLGGSVTQMMIEMNELRIQQMKDQQAIQNGEIDPQEYYAAKREKLLADQQERNRQQILRRFDVNYGTPTTEEGWKHQAATEFRKSGESSWYNYCMDQAAKCHVEGK